jgi:hypothetical protein
MSAAMHRMRDPSEVRTIVTEIITGRYRARQRGQRAAIPRCAMDTRTQPRVLICVQDSGVSDLLELELEVLGCSASSIPFFDWMDGSDAPYDAIILDAWPLRHAEALARARVRLAAQPAALILLADTPSQADPSHQLGAVATLPLFFSLQILERTVRQAARVAQRRRRP